MRFNRIGRRGSVPQSAELVIQSWRASGPIGSTVGSGRFIITSGNSGGFSWETDGMLFHRQHTGNPEIKTVLVETLVWEFECDSMDPDPQGINQQVDVLNPSQELYNENETFASNTFYSGGASFQKVYDLPSQFDNWALNFSSNWDTFTTTNGASSKFHLFFRTASFKPLVNQRPANLIEL